MKLLNVPFLVLFLSICIGILTGCYFEIFALKPLFLSILTCIIILSALWVRSNKIFKTDVLFGMGAIIFFVVFGVTLVAFHNPKNNASHYANKTVSQKDYHDIQFTIKERLKPTNYYEKYVVSLIKLDSISVSGDILLKVSKSTKVKPIKIGTTYYSYASIQSIPRTLNPYQFDYANYLRKKHLYDEVSISAWQLIDLAIYKHSLHSYADQIRNHINLKLENYRFTKQQLSIINALLLGQRQDIDPKIFSNYSGAGAIHILAVSGLHVGIILMLLNFLLRPLIYLKNGILIRTILIISLLWGFAIIAGLSPSILRSVTMFSFIAIGLYRKTQNSVYNALFVSMFFLLCANPFLVFSAGFQLSYLAVFAIVWMQPIFASIYKPKFYIDKLYWNTLTVTIAAQLGVLPLSLFYFHQFPLLFFVSNLVIIPILGLILGYGIVVIILAAMNFPSTAINELYGNCITAMNKFIAWVSEQEEFLISNIFFTLRMLIASYLFIIAFVFFLKKFNPTRAYVFTISIFLLFCTIRLENYRTSHSEELVIFHTYKNSVLGIQQGTNLKIFSKDSISRATKKFLLQNYMAQTHSEIQLERKLKNVYQYREKTIFVIDSFGIYNLKGMCPDIILLSKSPKIHLDRIIDSLQPKQIVADGSNYPSYLDHWETTCSKQKIPFHRTDKKGAFILKE